MDLENEQRESMALPLPVVPRLDRLDHLIKLLEDNHKLLKKQESIKTTGANADYDDDGDGDDDMIKPVSTALQEVHYKGTLMDRIALLEQRVLQLSIQMDMEYKSSGSSLIRQPPIDPDADVTVATVSGHRSSKESFRVQNELEESQEVIQVRHMNDVKRLEQTSMVAMQGCGYRRWRRKTPAMNRKKLFEWLRI